MKNYLLTLVSILLFYSIQTENVYCSIPIDTTETSIRILGIGHYNDDLVQDTIIGASSSNFKHKPRFIYWGNDSTSSIPDSLKVSYTEIVYHTDWYNLIVATNLDYMNNDTIMDIGLFMGGNVVDTNITVGDSLRARVKKVLIFGQSGLDTIPFINVFDIDTFQVEPFTAMQMRFGHELINPNYRELNNSISYEFKTIDLDLTDPNITAPPLIRSNIELKENEYELNFFPNPVREIANIEIKGFPLGNYKLRIYDELASVVLEKSIRITSRAFFKDKYNISKLPSGAYYLFIEGESRKIGPVKFIIIK